MTPGVPDLRPVGSELSLPGLGQAFALRHDVVDRIGGELHGFLAAVVLEPLEHRIAMPEPVHVAGRQLRAEGIVGGEGVPVGQGQEVGPDALDIPVRFDGARSPLHANIHRRPCDPRRRACSNSPKRQPQTWPGAWHRR